MKAPVLFEYKEDTPLAVFDNPLVFDLSELKPIAVLLVPVLFIFESPLPITVLDANAPTPLPTVNPFTVKSYAPRLTAWIAPE